MRSTFACVLAAGLAWAEVAAAATVVLQPSSQDSFLRHENPNTPSGSGPANTRIRVKSDGSGNPQATWWRGILQFDLSSVPQFASISLATLELFEGNTGTTRTYGVHRANGPWLQATVKWNTQPPFNAAPTATNTVGDAPRDFRSFNVLADVQAWVNNPSANHGWIVKDQSEASGTENINFVSMEDTTEPTHRPRLTITFTAPPCSTNAQCVDGNLCTTNERCVAGSCVVDPVSCNDSNACTDDLCDPDIGCVNTVGECNDGFDCTIDGCLPVSGCFHTVVPSVCTEGGCRTGTCVADPGDPTLDPFTGCTVTSQQPDGTTCAADTDQCTSDVCASGHCTHPDAPGGTPCSDGSACTQSDTCNGSGGCVPGAPVVCTPLDQCHVAGNCDPFSGLCSNPTAANGTPCGDGSACTQVDTCQAGACVGGNPIVCTPLDQCHVAGVCNTLTGVCSNPAAPDGTGCSDGNACSQGDQCLGGTCTGGNPVSCVAQDQCHVAGVCDPQTGNCSNPTQPDGTGCSDGDACTQTDACVGGSCTGTNSVVCPAPAPCHVPGTCNPGTGVCSNPNAPNGTGCNDNDACTQTDACNGGSCVGSNPVVCTASDQCHVAGTCNSLSGVCSNPSALDGTGCNDGDACTQTDACSGGTCVGADPVVCPAPGVCHLPGSCDPETGLCSNPTAADGTGCDDGVVCTFNDQCGGGVCMGTSATCGDGLLQSACNEQCDPPGPDCTATCQYICGPPRGDCKLPSLPGKARLQMKDSATDAKDRFAWKWLRGTPTTLAEIGDPFTGTEYLVCVYDQSPAAQPIMRMRIPGGTGWKVLGTKGFVRKNPAPYAPEGDQITVLKSGVAGKSKVQTKGRDVALGLPSLPLTGAVTVQLKNGAGATGTCWSATFSTPTTNTSTVYKAKGD